MFIRFREYKLATGHISLRCEIVENYRDKCSGKVRQRSISYLGSVRTQFLKYSRVRDEFWRRVERKLSGLPLSDSEVQKVRSTINRRIPRELTPAPRLDTTRNDADADNIGPAPVQTLSSPEAEAREQTTEELLADLRRRLGVTL